MNIKELSIPCVKLITPEIHHDSRGYFLETFNLNKLESCLNSRSFVQDNETYSEYGVLRGIHFQSPPYAQSKLMRVIQGEVFDVIVDLRSDSPTFGKHLEIILTGDSKKMLYVPRGFAHGFLVMSEKAVFYTKLIHTIIPNLNEHWIGRIRHSTSIGLCLRVKYYYQKKINMV